MNNEQAGVLSCPVAISENKQPVYQVPGSQFCVTTCQQIQATLMEVENLAGTCLL